MTPVRVILVPVPVAALVAAGVAVQQVVGTGPPPKTGRTAVLNGMVKASQLTPMVTAMAVPVELLVPNPAAPAAAVAPGPTTLVGADPAAAVAVVVAVAPTGAWSNRGLATVAARVVMAALETPVTRR